MDEKEREKIRKELRKVADEFLETVREEVDSCVLLCDAGRLGRLVATVNTQMGYELVRTIREKGFSKELTELCDKVGRGRRQK